MDSKCIPVKEMVLFNTIDSIFTRYFEEDIY